MGSCQNEPSAPVKCTAVDRMVMQTALKIVRFCDFSPEIMSTQFRVVFEGPVSRLEKDRDQTGPGPIKTGNY